MAGKDQALTKKMKVEVSSWLTQIFGQEFVPDFELNAQTIQLLHQLLQASQYNETNTHMYVEDLKKKTEEYNADAQRVSNLLDKLSLSSNSFTSSGTACIQALAKTGALLNIKDASDTSYMLSLQELHSESNELAKNLRSGNENVSKHSRKTQDSLIKHDSLQQALDFLDHKCAQAVSENPGRKQTVTLLKKNIEANESMIAKLQTELEKTGLGESDYHERLVKKKENLDNLQNKLGPLKSELKSYASLPPNVVETKVKIEQMKRELALLQARMSDNVDISLL